MVMPLGLVVELGPSMQGGHGRGLCVLLKACPFSPSVSKDHETKRHHLCEEHKLRMRHVFCFVLCMWKKRFHKDVGDFCCTIKDVLLRRVRNCLFDRGKMIIFHILFSLNFAGERFSWRILVYPERLIGKWASVVFDFPTNTTKGASVRKTHTFGNTMWKVYASGLPNFPLSTESSAKKSLHIH